MNNDLPGAIRERGLSFDRSSEFDFETAFYFVDSRKEYREKRRVAVGYLDRRLHGRHSSN
jgi:uncharacterized DUF497 family protein